MNAVEKSEEIRAGLRKGFRDSTSKLAQRRCYDYGTDSNGGLVINPDKAAVVRWIFERYLDGDSLGAIAIGLEEQSISSLRGRPKWSREMIDKLFS